MSADQLAYATAQELIELADIFETVGRRLLQLADHPTVAAQNMLRVAEGACELARTLRVLATLAPLPPPEVFPAAGAELLLGPLCALCELPVSSVDERGRCVDCAARREHEQGHHEADHEAHDKPN